MNRNPGIPRPTGYEGYPPHPNHRKIDMQVISYSDAKKNLESVFDQVVDDADAAVITHGNGHDVVVMSKADYDGLMKTLRLLRFPNQ